MKAHEKLPTLDEIKDYARTMRAKEQAVARCPDDESIEHSYTKILSVLAAAAIHQPHKNVIAARDAVDNIKHHVATKEIRIAALEQGMESMKKLVRELAAVRQSDKDELQAKLEAAETEAARLELMAMEGAEALARERENSARIKRENDAVREENQGIRVRLGYEKDLAKCTQQEVRRLRNLIQDWITADCEGNNNDILEAEEALREAVG